MYSFYGGKQGRTYHIVERYDSIYLDPAAYNDFDSSKTDYEQGEYFKYNEKFYKVLTTEGSISDIDTALRDYKIVQIKGMVNCFSLGGSYTDVNYGEYVIIDTFLNERHRNDEVNGLLYRRGLEYNQVGTTTRPIRQQYDSQEAYNADWYNYILHPGAGAVYIGQILGPQGLSPQLKGKKWSEISAETQGQFSEEILQSSLGYNPQAETEEEKFNDAIKFGWANIKDANGDTIECYLSFDIPTPVFNIHAKLVSPYLNSDGEIVVTHESSAFPNEDDTQVITGSIGNYTGLLHLHSKSGPNAQNPHPFFYDYQLAVPNGIHGTSVEGLSVNDTSEGKFLRATFIDYDESEEGISYSTDVAPYKIIDNIEGRYVSFAEAWQLGNTSLGTIIRANRSNTKIFICIKQGETKISEPQQGNLVTSAYASDLIDQQIILKTGTIFKACTPQQAQLENISEWLYTELSIDSMLYKLIVNYTYGNSSEFDLNLPYNVFLGSNGILYAQFVDSRAVPVGSIDTIKYISLQDGVFTAETNRQKTYTIGIIQYIEDLKLKGDCIAAFYSNADYRRSFIDDQSKIEGKDYWIDEEDGQVWVNLGSIIGANHIEGDYDLNTLLSSGPLEGNKAGWTVTVTIDENHVYQYAYDYHQTHTWTRPDNQVEVTSNWYPIAGYDATLVKPQKIMIIDSSSNQMPSTVSKHTDLSVNGFWLVKTSGHNHN